jgi:hypothetical protein
MALLSEIAYLTRESANAPDLAFIALIAVVLTVDLLTGD